jgi:hypothetical protein
MMNRRNITVLTSAVVILLLFFAGMTAVRAQTGMGSSIGNTSSGDNLGMYYVFVEPDAYYKFRGGSVFFTGSHFSPGETVTVTRDGVFLDTVRANSQGTFITQEYGLPAADGTIDFTFKGSASNIPYTVRETVGGGSAWLTLSNYYAAPGSSLVIRGNHFSHNEWVRVRFADEELGWVRADAAGNWIKTATVSHNGSGLYRVSATGWNSGISATQRFTEAQGF